MPCAAAEYHWLHEASLQLPDARIALQCQCYLDRCSAAKSDRAKWKHAKWKHVIHNCSLSLCCMRHELG